MMNRALDYLRFYDLERYLFETVALRFRKERQLTAFDILCIANWKAPRARSHVAGRLCRLGSGDIEAGAAAVASAARPDRSDEDRFREILGTCGFGLPMGSAILTVLDTDTFTVYDRRVCDELGDFHKLVNTTNLDRLWRDYIEYRKAVCAAVPVGLSLRDADRWLWARNAARDLVRLVNERA